MMEEVRRLNATHKLLDGSLFYGIGEQRVKDADGKKGYEYTVYFKVMSDEPFYTEEEIRKELQETYRRMRMETDEMFRKDYPEELDDFMDESKEAEIDALLEEKA